MYDYVNNRLYPGNPDVAKSYALRLLIHYLGDIHQPMHVEARFNDENPTGDKGGNTFPLPYHYEVDELHALWDKVLYSEHANIARPFTDATYDAFQSKTIDPYMATYKYSLSDKNVAGTDPDVWAHESFDITTETVYEGVTENEPVS